MILIPLRLKYGNDETCHSVIKPLNIKNFNLLFAIFKNRKGSKCDIDFYKGIDMFA